MPKVTFILDNIRSAFNVGSIFRTADGLNFDIHLIGMTPVPGQDKKLDKTSLSSLNSVSWKYFDKVENWFESVLLNKQNSSESNLMISVEEGNGLKTVSLFDLQNTLNDKSYSNIYLILGHEINGVSQFLLNKSDFILKIPMFGKKNSLNVATCAGVVGYRVKEHYEL